MKEELVDYILDNREYFKEKYKHLVEKRDAVKGKESKLFHDDIDSSMNSAIITGMSGELSRAIGADMETIMIVLEEVNFEELFK